MLLDFKWSSFRFFFCCFVWKLQIASGASLKSVSLPISSWIDTSGNVYTANTFGYVLYKLNTTNSMNVIAGTLNVPGEGNMSVKATKAQMFLPYAVHGDSYGNIIYSDTGNHRIILINNVTQKVSVLVGLNTTAGFNGNNLPGTSTMLANPTGLWLMGRDLLFVETGNHRVRKLSGATG